MTTERTITVVLRRQTEYTLRFTARDETAARRLAADYLGVDDNGEDVETNRPRRLLGFRIRGEAYTLLTEGEA